MDRSSPALSVIVACFHTHEWVVRAVSSALKQTVLPLEVLLISDDQTDYLKTLHEVGVPLDRVRQFDTGTVGAGCYQTRKIGFANARGDCVTRLDCDDSWDERYLECALPMVGQHGACLSPVKTVDLSGENEIRANGYHVLPRYAARQHLEVKEFIWLPFGWNTIFSRSLTRGLWEAGLNTDLTVEAEIFEKIGFVPFHPFRGYRYHIRPGSICHNPQAPYNIAQEYSDWLKRIELGESFGLSAALVGTLQEMLRQRIASIQHYLKDLEQGALQYTPQVVLDILLYPNRS